MGNRPLLFLLFYRKATYYVLFTFASLVSTIILFKGLDAPATGIASIVCAFITICIGITILQLSKLDPKSLAKQPGVDRRTTLLLKASRSHVRPNHDHLNHDPERDDHLDPEMTQTSHAHEDTDALIADPGPETIRGGLGVVGSIIRARSVARSRRGQSHRSTSRSRSRRDPSSASASPSSPHDSAYNLGERSSDALNSVTTSGTDGCARYTLYDEPVRVRPTLPSVVEDGDESMEYPDNRYSVPVSAGPTSDVPILPEAGESSNQEGPERKVTFTRTALKNSRSGRSTAASAGSFYRKGTTRSTAAAAGSFYRPRMPGTPDNRSTSGFSDIHRNPSADVAQGLRQRDHQAGQQGLAPSSGPASPRHPVRQPSARSTAASAGSFFHPGGSPDSSIEEAAEGRRGSSMWANLLSPRRHRQSRFGSTNIGSIHGSRDQSSMPLTPREGASASALPLQPAHEVEDEEGVAKSLPELQQADESDYWGYGYHAHHAQAQGSLASLPLNALQLQPTGSPPPLSGPPNSTHTTLPLRLDKYGSAGESAGTSTKQDSDDTRPDTCGTLDVGYDHSRALPGFDMNPSLESGLHSFSVAGGRKSDTHTDTDAGSFDELGVSDDDRLPNVPAYRDTALPAFYYDEAWAVGTGAGDGIESQDREDPNLLANFGNPELRRNSLLSPLSGGHERHDSNTVPGSGAGERNSAPPPVSGERSPPRTPLPGTGPGCAYADQGLVDAYGYADSAPPSLRGASGTAGDRMTSFSPFLPSPASPSPSTPPSPFQVPVPEARYRTHLTPGHLPPSPLAVAGNGTPANPESSAWTALPPSAEDDEGLTPQLPFHTPVRAHSPSQQSTPLQPMRQTPRPRPRYDGAFPDPS